MNEQREKFERLLRELFQFDCADLDFGIYRIMNHKRDIIEKFIREDLLQAVSDELDKDILKERQLVAEQLQETRKAILEVLDYQSFDGDGNLVKHQDTNLGKRYLGLLARAGQDSDRESMERDIFNRLHDFFSRYYQEGDFISKRRYSQNQRYVIPYNGEEVLLHWANSDQYYIKTAEHFQDYRFKADSISVHFQLQTANVEQNNVKGEKRFFMALAKEMDWNAKERRLRIPFEYRPLTAQEKISHPQNRIQETLNASALQAAPAKLDQAPEVKLALTAEYRKDGNGGSVSVLEHHLRQYTRRNASDFFIHRDLRGFLSRELDFYLKHEALNLDPVEAAGENLAAGWFQTMRLIKKIGGQIIDFLDQIESFQKMLWEKRKFITETQYCITVGNIDQSFYPEIADCEAQWEEWKDLLHIDAEEPGLLNSGKNRKDKRIAFLKDHPTLALDTRHFQSDFTDRLLSGMEDLDAKTDGLLVDSENFQAIGLLSGKYKSQIKCVHIDPPYNTQTSSFLYKNDYKHSSWLAMMENRISASIPLLSDDGAFLCHIDENEYENLHILFNRIGLPNTGTIVWDKRNPMTGGGGIAIQHEYVIWRSKSGDAVNLQNGNTQIILDKAEELVDQYDGVSEKVKKEFSGWVKENDDLSEGEKAYAHMDDAGRVYTSVSLRAPEPRTDQKFFKPLLHPVTGKPCPVPPNGFSRTPETLEEMMNREEILFGKDETTQPRQKRFLKPSSSKQLSSILPHAKKGKSDLKALGVEDFPYCHAASFYMELLGAALMEDDSLVMDYFAGSGTTGHAVVNLNREDGKKRKFILVEMGHHFEKILLPRLKKVTFASKWREGRPQQMTSAQTDGWNPRIIKYLRLESPEDALNNIAFEDPQKSQQALQIEDYLIKYMLRWSTKHSATLLNMEKLDRPFSYRLRDYSNGQNGEKAADLPETFNCLAGLQVQTRRVYDDDGRRYLVYRGLLEHKTVAVIWRETHDWKQADYERDRKFVEDQGLNEDADEVFVNSDSTILNAKSLDPLFKKCMFAPVEI